MKYLNSLILAMILATACWGNTSWKADAGRGKNLIKFTAQGFPSALSLEGKGENGVTGGLMRVPDGLKGVFSFVLDNLETGMSLRDRHMKEKYLETSKYPVAKLAITQLRLPADFQGKVGSASKVPFKGRFSVHGIERDVEGMADVSSDGKIITLALNFNLDMRHFQIREPSFSGISIKPEIAVNVNSEMPLR